MPTAISIREISKVFGAGASAAVAVDGVSLGVEPGELFFLLGPSGCGKTTLLRMIAGFIEPTSGAIFSDGRDITGVAPSKRNTGMVFQSYALWPHMTVAQNVGFGLSVRRVGADERERRVIDALAAVRMAEYGERKPNQLSGGQQQRVALARALVIRPDVLLLDEPLSNLDARLRIELRSEIRRVCKEAGITAVYVTHDQKEALSMADRVAVLDRGRVVQVGAPDELYRRPRSRFVAEFLGETNFLEGTAGARRDGAVEIKTAAGVLEAGVGSGESGVAGGVLLVSIRPEALKVNGGGQRNVLRGRIVESTYLGELAQHVVELPGPTLVKVADLNPASARGLRGESVTLTVAPEDVVVVPGE